MSGHLKFAASLLCAAVLHVSASRGVTQTTEEPPPRFQKLGSKAGVENYSLGDWGIVSAILENPNGHPADLLVTSSFAEQPDSQFGREFWVPSRAVLKSWYPVRTPATVGQSKISLDIESMLFDKTGGNEKLILQGKARQRTYHEDLPLDQTPWPMGMIAPLPTRYLPGDERYRKSSEQADDLVQASIVALRLTSPALTRRVRIFETESLPPTTDSLQQLDRLVLASDRLADDAAALRSVREWVQNGGLLWIMLDQISPATVTKLFGDAVDLSVVDRVALSSATIDEAGAPKGTPPFSRDFDNPVQFVRCLTSGVEVQHSINGWPASFWQRLGKGKVLFTTLEPRAWIRQKIKGDAQSNDPQKQYKYMALPPLVGVANVFFEPEETPNFEVSQLEPLLGEQIGREIVSRGPVLVILGLFCAAILLAGIWLVRKERLEQLGWLGPVGAVFAAGALIVMGMKSKESVPDTEAVTQIVQTVPGTRQATMTGLLGLYYQNQTSAKIGAVHGGRFEPSLNGMAGVTRRMIWTDADAWHFENLSLPGAAITVAPFEYSGTTDGQIAASGTFGPNGFQGTLSAGPLKEPGDAFIMNAVQSGAAAKLNLNGSITSSHTDLLTTGQFVSGTLLSDEQRRRQEACRQIFPQPSTDERKKNVEPQYFEQPTLFVWAKPLDTGFDFPGERRKVGSALVSIPLQLERPQPGTKSLISSTFLTTERVDGPAEFRSGSAYSNRLGRWEEIGGGAAHTWLRFQLPKVVLPYKVDRATMNVTIKAPARLFQVNGFVDGQLVKLAEEKSPVATLQFEINDSKALQLDANGGLILGVSVGAPNATSISADVNNAGNIADVVVQNVEMKWRIDSLNLNLSGETLAP